MQEVCPNCKAVNDFKNLAVGNGHVYDCERCKKQQRIGVPLAAPIDNRRIPDRLKRQRGSDGNGAKPRVS